MADPRRGAARLLRGRPATLGELMVQQLESFARYTPGLNALRSVAGRVRTVAGVPESKAVVEVEAGQSTLPPEIFYTKMPRHVVAGASRAMWNFSIGTVFSPVILVGCSLGGLRHGPVGAAKGVLEGVVFGSLWLGLGYAGAFAQVAGGGFYTVSGPYWLFGARRFWHPVHREWTQPTMAMDAELNLMPSDGEIWEEAMARMARQRDGPAGEMPSKGREYYAILGITEKATQTDIKKAYRKASLHLHPDRNPSPNAQEEFEKMSKAYKVLSDPLSRKKYDAGGEEALNSNNANSVDRRDTLRSLFGGDVLRDLAGEVRMSRFSRRIIDKVHYSTEETAILTVRSMDRAAATLLVYLDAHPGPKPEGDEATVGSLRAHEKQVKNWEAAVKKRSNAYINTGIARDIIFVLGEAYHAVLDEDAMTAAQRVVNGISGAPGRASDRLKPWLHIVRKGSQANKDPAIVMETVWGFSVLELRATARYAGTKVVLDDSASPEERARRKAALRDLARLLVKWGKPWDGVSDSVMRSIGETAAADMRKRSQATDRNRR